VLEAGGLVCTEKVDRVRTCRLEPATLRAAEQWIGQRRTQWERRLDRLGAYLAEPPTPPHPDAHRARRLPGRPRHGGAARGGTNGLLDALGASLQREPASA
jgi:hypothetical protein